MASLRYYKTIPLTWLVPINLDEAYFFISNAHLVVLFETICCNLKGDGSDLSSQSETVKYHNFWWEHPERTFSKSSMEFLAISVRRLRYMGDTCGIISSNTNLPKELPNEDL